MWRLSLSSFTVPSSWAMPVMRGGPVTKSPQLRRIKGAGDGKVEIGIIPVALAGKTAVAVT